MDEEEDFKKAHGWLTDKDLLRNLEDILNLLRKDIREADTPSDLEDGKAWKLIEDWIKELKEEEKIRKQNQDLLY
jgi:hypothetical protein